MFLSSVDYSNLSNYQFELPLWAWVIYLLAIVYCVFIEWKIFVKAGKPGWAALIPFYNTYVLFDIVYGEGIKFLFLLIPFFNIYVAIKLYFDLAKVYGKSIGFGFGLLFLPVIFESILAFDKSTYLGPIKK